MNDHPNESFWIATAGTYRPNPPLEGNCTVDVAIIGGGFTGLSTAYHLRCADPTIRVAVLEAEFIGYGASGRNGGFSVTNFGLEPVVTKRLFGQQRTIEAHRYMERAVSCVDALVREHDIQSDYCLSGFFRIATTPANLRRLRRDLDLLASMRIGGVEWIDQASLRSEVDSPLFFGALWEPRAALLNPTKQVRELKRIAAAAGAHIYEGTPVTAVTRGSRFTLITPGGTITAGKVIFATNAYSHLIPQLRHRQVPAFTHMVVTQPLTSEQRATIGWRHGQGIESMRNLVHYFRLTADGRLAMGGSDVTIAFGRDMNRDLNPRVFADLERDVVRFFPGLREVGFTHRWGGPVSIMLDTVPALGQLGDPRALYSVGCMGHGVSLAHLNGRTLADLTLERKTDLTDVWFVNRRVLSWPPEPLRFLASHTVRGCLRLHDRLQEGHRRSVSLPTPARSTGSRM